MKKILFVILIAYSSIFAETEKVNGDEEIGNYLIDISHKRDKEFIQDFYYVKKNNFGNYKLDLTEDQRATILDYKNQEYYWTISLVTSIKIPEELLKNKKRVYLRLNYNEEKGNNNISAGFFRILNIKNKTVLFAAGENRKRKFLVNKDTKNISILQVYKMKKYGSRLGKTFYEEFNKNFRVLKIEFSNKAKRGKKVSWIKSDYLSSRVIKANNKGENNE